MAFFTRKITTFSLLILVFLLGGCNRQNSLKSESSSADFSSIDFSNKVNILYAQHFSIEKSVDYSILKINGEKPIFVVEEGASVPSGIPADYTILKKPVLNTYLVSSSQMDFFIKLNILDKLKFSGTKKESWFLPEAANAMENGSLIYAGKYNAPDYEILYTGKTGLSIQNTMIYHKPEVKEKLEQLNIPVLVEKSSYEKNPLGKLEWIKLYGFLYDRENEAEEFFESQLEEYSAFENVESSGKTIAFFYITSANTINVRKPGDYVAKSIEMAGGKYFLDASDLEEDNAFSSMNMQAEQFYVKAKDADILVYNATIDGMVFDKKTLLQKYPLLKDFKAFKNDSIYCTEKKLFQEITGTVDFMQDLNRILNSDENNLRYLVKIK